ncbi:hypothetical protein F4801DRAFT_124818 [Xylaria longipes]|nr:hypothetical protein F4801DRAFT_124818 [Xylaria longipes]
MFSSRDAVLHTAELLQEILLQLDMRTLLTSAQLVSRQWHELITSSPALKQALYFEPVPWASGSATQNPLLAEVFPPWFPEETKDEQVDGTKPPKMINREDFRSLPMAKASRRHAFMHPSATWRHMLVQQPPILSLGRWTTSHAMMGDFHAFPLQEFPGGLRMGSFYDLAQDWVCQVVSGFKVFRDPSAVTSYGYTRYSRRMEPEKEAELESFARQASVVLFCYMVVQCTDDWPNVYFEEDFTFAPTKEQRDRWHFYKGLYKGLPVGSD